MPTYMSQSFWNGSLEDSSVTVRVGSGSFDAGVSAKPRKGKVSNPEEMVGAALASCYGLILAKTLGEAQIASKSIETTAAVDVEHEGATPTITKIGLDVDVQADGLDQERLNTFAERAGWMCPVAQSLGGTKISIAARLSS